MIGGVYQGFCALRVSGTCGFIHQLTRPARHLKQAVFTRFKIISILGVSATFCIHMTGERQVIGLSSKGFWTCSKEEQVLLYQMSGNFQSNGLSFQSWKYYLVHEYNDRKTFDNSLCNLFLTLNQTQFRKKIRMLCLLLSQLFVKLSGFTHLKSSSNVTLITDRKNWKNYLTRYQQCRNVIKILGKVQVSSPLPVNWQLCQCAVG